jgi:hypothetical protein
MLLQITKNAGKPHVISYKRDDGTVTWMYADDFFVRHDLSHYCIEKNLGFTKAFMGMLNAGMDVKDFEDREKRQTMIIDKEALYAENMANLFLMEIAQSDFEDFNQTAKDTFGSWNKKIPPPTLLQHEILSIRESLRSLFELWDELPVGETMDLLF